MSKLKSQKELVKIVKKLKKQGKKIVAISGSFDLIHFGHIKALEEARKKGDVLIVLLNSDSSIRAYKGKNRPIFSQEKRVKVLSAIEYVSFITIFDEITPVKILEKIKPHIFFQSPEWGKNCVERAVVEKYGGKVYVGKFYPNFSTTNLIEKISNILKEPAVSAVFLDRDGVINVNEPEYVHRKEDFKFTEGAIHALKKLSKSNYKIIIVTNQSGIGRGYFTLKDFKKLNSWMLNELKKNNVRIDRVYYCPHKPEDECFCRKPKPGLILKAVKDFNINLSKSWLIGDDVKDIILGRSLNIKTIKIGKKMPKQLKLEPNYYAKNLLEAINIILKKPRISIKV